VCEVVVAFELLLYLSYMGYIDCSADKYMRLVVDVALVHRIDLVLCNVRRVGLTDKIEGDIARSDRTASLFERRPAFEHSFGVIVVVGAAVVVVAVVKVLMVAVLVYKLCTVVVETMVVVVRRHRFVKGHRVHLRRRRRLPTFHMAFAVVDLFVDFVVFVEAED